MRNRVSWLAVAASLALLACGSVEEEAENLPDTSDPSQILTLLPEWAGWCYEGPAGLRSAWEDAVSWWRAQGRDVGGELCGDEQIRVVDMSDRPGPIAESGEAQWAAVSYRGDAGADLRLFEGMRSASADEIENAFRHELGHVLGLQHSRDSRCLMFGNGLSGGELCAHERALLTRP